MKIDEIKTKVLKQERYKIKTPKTIRIYDESYLNDSESIGLCAIIENIPNNKNAELVFEMIEDTCISKYTKRPISVISFMVKIFIASDQSILDTFFKNEYHLAKVKFNKLLGCDTASFIVEIDDRFEEIDTGADGYYGEHMAYKYNVAHYIEFQIASDMISEERFREKLAYLFELEEIKEVQSND